MHYSHNTHILLDGSNVCSSVTDVAIIIKKKQELCFKVAFIKNKSHVFEIIALKYPSKKYLYLHVFKLK